MIIYCAGPWAHRQAIHDVVAPYLRRAGHQIISRWHDEWADQNDTTDPEILRTEAWIDWQDLRHAEVLVVMNYQVSEGKAVEQGIALERGIPIILVGTPSNVFHHLPHVRCVETLEDTLPLLAQPWLPGGAPFLRL